MGKLFGGVKKYANSLVGTAIVLIALFFVLNFVKNRNWGVISSGAGWAESHANGSAYDSVAMAPVAGVPSTTGYSTYGAL